MKEIITLKEIKDFDSDFKCYDHYERLECIKDYLVEHKDYSHDHIGDNTDFEIKGDLVVVDLEII